MRVFRRLDLLLALLLLALVHRPTVGDQFHLHNGATLRGILVSGDSSSPTFEIKTEAGLPASIPARIEDVVAKVKATAGDEGLDPGIVEVMWRKLIDWSIAREAQSIDFE